MKKNIKLYSLLLLFLSVAVYAQVPCPTCPPGGGGVGGTTPGVQASPIDMYLYILGIVAVIFITLFAKKIKMQKI